MSSEPGTPLIFSDIFEHFERGRVPYVVVSGVAVVLHGHVRPIFDLDIVVSPKHEESNRALHALFMAGFASTLPLPLHSLTVSRMFDQSGREVDVFARYHIPFADLWSDSVQITLGTGTARVASLQHLIQAKRITGRPHDLEDIEGLRALEV